MQLERDANDSDGYRTAMPFDDIRIEWSENGCECRVDDTAHLCEAVVTAVDRCRRRDDRDAPLPERTPLYEHIDPDALGNLFSHCEHSNGMVSFTYGGYRVTATSEGNVTVRDETRVEN